MAVLFWVKVTLITVKTPSILLYELLAHVNSDKVESKSGSIYMYVKFQFGSAEVPLYAKLKSAFCPAQTLVFVGWPVNLTISAKKLIL